MSLNDGLYSITNFHTKNAVTAPTDSGAYLFGDKYTGSLAQQVGLLNYLALIIVVLTA